MEKIKPKIFNKSVNLLKWFLDGKKDSERSELKI